MRLEAVKNPVREHGASSMEKANSFWGLIANGRRWSAPQEQMAILPRSGEHARESGAFWLFHVTKETSERKGEDHESTDCCSV